MIKRNQTARRTAAQQLPLSAWSFTCTCCEVVENQPAPTPPANWAVEHIKGAAYVFCPDCAIDLPSGGLQ